MSAHDSRDVILQGFWLQAVQCLGVVVSHFSMDFVNVLCVHGPSLADRGHVFGGCLLVLAFCVGAGCGWLACPRSRGPAEVEALQQSVTPCRPAEHAARGGSDVEQREVIFCTASAPHFHLSETCSGLTFRGVGLKTLTLCKTCARAQAKRR